MKVILLGLIRAGAPCLVLNVNREYDGLPGVRTYGVGKDFKLGVREIGVEAMSVMLEVFGTPATSLLYFKTRLTRLLQEKKEFIGIDELIWMAEGGEFYPMQSGYAADAVNRTLRSRLEALKLTGYGGEGRAGGLVVRGVVEGDLGGRSGGARSIRAFDTGKDGVRPGVFTFSLCARGGGREGSVRLLRVGSPLRGAAGNRCSCHEGEAHGDHKVLHHEYTYSASRRGFKGSG